MQKRLNIILAGALMLFISSCVSSGDNPGWEYAPDMYVSEGYEPFSQVRDKEPNPNGMTMRLPVPGSVARGQLANQYPYPNTGEGYIASAANMPGNAPTKANVKEGERLYNIYCWHCHGKKGDNKGPLFTSKKFPAPAWKSYSDPVIKDLPVGQAYHTITYGKNLMGGHAHMLSPDERWKVVHYVKYLSHGEAFQFASEDAAGSTSSAGGANTYMFNGNVCNIVELNLGDQQLLASAMESIRFRIKSSEIKEESKPRLNEVADFLKRFPDYKGIVSGYAGVTLVDDNAEKYASERAEAVKTYLVEQGVNPANLMHVGYGNESADTDVTSAESRKKNRRVEILIVK